MFFPGPSSTLHCIYGFPLPKTLVKTLAKLNNDGQTGLEPFARLLLDHAAIAEGRLDDPQGFASRLQTLMAKAADSMGA